MNLESKINADIKQAMLAKKKDELEALRAIKSSLLLLKTTPEVQAAGGAISEAQEITMLQKMVKQRKEAAAIYEQQKRADLAAVETAQAAVIARYLPQPLSRDEVEQMVHAVIAEVGASGMKDMGRVMATLTPRLAGRAEGKLVSDIVKHCLNG